MKNNISATIVAHSVDQFGNELVSILATFPRIILAEVNTHRMLSKNTSSSRAIPFKKMVEAIQSDPFIPIAWQKHHSGMQGSEYMVEEDVFSNIKGWLQARDYAIEQATYLSDRGVTKQLCNRILEPYMWTTMLITGMREQGAWDNFFELRNPAYEWRGNSYKSVKDIKKEVGEETWIGMQHNYPMSEQWWRERNKGHAEIHIMDLAEKVYDAINESTPKLLSPGEWHIPFEDNINIDKLYKSVNTGVLEKRGFSKNDLKVKVSTAMAARTSYTIVGDEKEIDYQKMVGLHDRLIAQNPPHSSPMEHCARVMSDEEYETHYKGILSKGLEYYHPQEEDMGWCRNYKGFIPYRHLIESV